MNDTRKRDLPASAMTKRDKAALAILAELMATAGFVQVRQTDDGVAVVNPPTPDVYLLMGALSSAAVAGADALFDALETPPELRDQDDFDHEGHP